MRKVLSLNIYPSASGNILWDLSTGFSSYVIIITITLLCKKKERQCKFEKSGLIYFSDNKN